jgi:hypothetical protein
METPLLLLPRGGGACSCTGRPASGRAAPPLPARSAALRAVGGAPRPARAAALRAFGRGGPPPPPPPPPPPQPEDDSQFAWATLRDRVVRPVYLPASFIGGSLTLGVRTASESFLVESEPLSYVGCCVVTGLMVTAFAWLLFEFTEDPAAAAGGGDQRRR